MEARAIPPFICLQCGRQFTRPCDLNKHAKSHSRPFKCNTPTCKYSTLGWPTRKELDRHINDMHSDSPQIHHCLFRPCAYRSKRLSNCKQHMEKTHGWTYTRSKSIGKRLPGCIKSEEAQVTSGLLGITAYATPELSVPEADEGRHYCPKGGPDYELDDFEREDGQDGQGGQDVDVLIPWSSPDTRVRRNVLFLQSFNHTYQPANPSSVAGTSISPYLSGAWSSVGSLSANRLASLDDDDASPSQADVPGRLRLLCESAHHPSICPGPATRLSYLNNTMERADYSGPAPSHHLAVHDTSNALGIMTPGEHKSAQAQLSPRPSEEDGPDRDRPRKRPKLSPAAGFRDSEMPDIFHAAHPQVYNRDQKVLFSSCHSTHKDISTLVRHLGRAPHKLDVGEGYISSFDIQAPGRSHAKAGLCRRCWACFNDRLRFDRHISAECEKVSKGKREKWLILYETFTPFEEDDGVHHSADAVGPGIHSQETLANTPATSNQRNDAMTETTEGAVGSRSSIPSPSPTGMMLPTGVAPHDVNEGTFVTLAEYERLLAEVRNIRQAVAELHSRLRSNEPMPALPDPNMGGNNTYAAQDIGLFTETSPTDATNGSGRSGDQPGQPRLLRSMNPRPAAVDSKVPLEVQRTLSRANSGLSSSGRSTIYHVTNSPPPPPRFEAPITGVAFQARPAGTSGLQHQPQSIADSGYWTEKNRNIMGGANPLESAGDGSEIPPAPATLDQHYRNTYELTPQVAAGAAAAAAAAAATATAAGVVSNSNLESSLPGWPVTPSLGWPYDQTAVPGPVYGGSHTSVNDWFPDSGYQGREPQFPTHADPKDIYFQPEE